MSPRCTLPYFPSAGFEDCQTVENTTCGFFYVTCPDQCQAFKTWTEAEAYWHEHCDAFHDHSAPPSIRPVAAPVTIAQPPSYVLTVTTTGSPSLITASLDSCSESSASSGSGVSDISSVSSLSSALTSSFGTSHAAAQYALSFPSAVPLIEVSLRAAGGAPRTPLKDQPRTLSLPVTPQMRVQLTPSGHAAGALLAARAAASGTAPPPTPVLAPIPQTPQPHPQATQTPALSILQTPTGPPNPPPLPRHPRPWWVALPPTPAATGCTASRLSAVGLTDVKLMVSCNYDKLEAWVTGEPFDGDM
ncbi:hypothetical protein C8J57DRAFT_1521239 [Mycena rebaudengoi]|nr:hypothetical protein C8J57DRAFT_1521239 [Mycena rebaudengoi]